MRASALVGRSSGREDARTAGDPRRPWAAVGVLRRPRVLGAVVLLGACVVGACAAPLSEVHRTLRWYRRRSGRS